MKVVKGLPFLAMGGLTLGLVGATVLAPVVNAATPAPANQQIDVTVNEVLAISAKANLATTIDPNSADTTKMADTIKVTSNLDKGYNLTVRNADTSDNADGALKGTKNGNEIPLISKAGDEPTGAKAAWGIKTDMWHTVPFGSSDGLPVGNAKAPGDGSHNVVYGVSATSTTPNDTYSANVVYTATPNA